MERWTSTICCMRYLDLLTQSWSISNQTYTVGRTFTWRNLEFTDTKMIDFKSDLHRWADVYVTKHEIYWHKSWKKVKNFQSFLDKFFFDALILITFFRKQLLGSFFSLFEIIDFTLEVWWCFLKSEVVLGVQVPFL